MERGCRLAVRVYEVLKNCEDYGLKDQMTRAVVSIPSNTAEGPKRNLKAEFIRYLHIAKGSAAELRTQIYIASQIGKIDGEIQKELIEELKIISVLLQCLIRSFKPSVPPKT